jgi:hypothetical protein
MDFVDCLFFGTFSIIVFFAGAILGSKKTKNNFFADLSAGIKPEDVPQNRPSVFTGTFEIRFVKRGNIQSITSIPKTTKILIE